VNGRIPHIAVDAMGGDHAPEEIVAGAVLAANEGLGRMLVVGDEARLRPLLASYAGSAIDVVHAPGAVAMDANPSQALRNSKETSLGAAVDLVRDGNADAVVSAGNSGAFLAIALVRLRPIEGVARPAIAVVYPAKQGPVIVLDSGANIAQPRVGIISVGEERGKGNALTIAATALLESSSLRFVGNVEGKDMLFNAADVCVCDGFVGNVILKLCEGAASLIGDIAVAEIKSAGPFTKLGALLVRPALRHVRDKISYEAYGGAPLLGLRGNCIVAHGRANRVAVRSAIRAAVAEVREDVVGRIGELIASSELREAKEA